MTRVLAGALTVAIAGAIFQSVSSSHGGGAAGGFTAGLSDAVWFLAALAAVGAVLTWAFVRSAPKPKAAPLPEAEHHHHRRFHL